MAPTHRSRPATDTRNSPEGPIRFGCSREDPTHGVGQALSISTKTHHTKPCDEPSWHRLLGTLLSSQGTDAHLLEPFGSSSEALSFSILPDLPAVPVRPVGLAVAGSGPPERAAGA